MAFRVRISIIDGSARVVGLNIDTPADTEITDGPLLKSHIVHGHTIDYSLAPSIVDRWRSMIRVLSDPPQAIPLVIPHKLDYVVSFLHRIVAGDAISRCLFTPSQFHPFFVAVLREHLSQPNDVYGIEISVAGYLEILPMQTGGWGYVSLHGRALSGRAFDGICKTGTLRIQQLAHANADTIMRVIENTDTSSLITLDATVNLREYYNRTVESASIHGRYFRCRFPMLRTLIMPTRDIPALDCTHCPRIACFVGIPTSAAAYTAVVKQIPSLTARPATLLDKEAEDAILAEHAPLLLDERASWHPRRNNAFYTVQTLFAVFFMSIDRLVAANSIAYPDPAAVERVLFYFSLPL